MHINKIIIYDVMIFSNIEQFMKEFSELKTVSLVNMQFSVKVGQDTDRLKHHQVFSIANIQDETQRRKQGVQMHQRKLCIADHMTWVETIILQGSSQQQY